MPVANLMRPMAFFLLAASSLIPCHALPCEPLVVGFHGAKVHGDMRDLLSQIKLVSQQQRSLKIQTRMFGWRDSDEERAKQYVENYNERCPRTPIVFIGHSYGADAAFDVAFYDGNTGVPDLLVTLDAVTHSAVFPRYLTNTKWINTYRRQIPAVLQALHPGAWLRFLFPDESCDAVASLGGHWGREIAADENFHAAEAEGHCDVAGLAAPARKEVMAALSGAM